MRGDNMNKKLYVLRNGIVIKDLGDGEVEVVSVPPNYVDKFSKEPANAGKWKIGTIHILCFGDNYGTDPLHYKGGAWGTDYDVVAAIDESAQPLRPITNSWLERYARWLFGGSTK
jgi:hypothetical protein